MAADKLPKVEASTPLEYGEMQTLLELDPATLDPARHYRWVLAHPLKIGKARLKHYEVVHKDEGVKTLAGYLDPTTDGTMKIQDVILMACPLESFRGRKRANLKKANSRLAAPKKSFRKNARRRNVRVLNEEDE